MAGVFHAQMRRGRNEAAARSAALRMRPAHHHQSVLEVDTQFAEDFQSKLNAADEELAATPTHHKVVVTAHDDELSTSVPCGFIHPLSYSKLGWDVFVCALIIYSAVVVPMRICFSMGEGSALQAWGYAVDALFCVDIIVSFFTVYMDDLGRAVLNHRRIASHYLRSWFLIDALSTLPVDLVVSWLNSGEGDNVSSLRLLRILRLARLLKMVRLLKINKLLSGTEGLQDMLNFNPAVARLAKFFFIAAFMGHLLGCFWFWVGTVQDDGVLTWIDDAGIRDASTASQYVSSMYWTFATITTVGYGDIGARTNTERVYSIFAQLIGASAFGFIIGNISSILERMDARAAAFKRRMDTLKEYLRHRDFPVELARRIVRYYEYYHSRKSGFDEATILGEVSTHLRNQIVLQSNHEAVKRIRFFSQHDEGLIAVLITAMKPMYQMAGELLCSQGHVGKEMYFILKGVVEATVRDLRADAPALVGLYLQGHYCGDVALVLNVRRPLTLRAVTHCDCFALSKEALSNALYHYEEVNRTMTTMATAKLDMLNDVRYSTACALRKASIPVVGRPDGQGPVSSPSRERQFKRQPCIFVNERLKPISTVPPNLLSEATLSLTEEYAQCFRPTKPKPSRLQSLVMRQMASVRLPGLAGPSRQGLAAFPSVRTDGGASSGNISSMWGASRQLLVKKPSGEAGATPSPGAIRVSQVAPSPAQQPPGVARPMSEASFPDAKAHFQPRSALTPARSFSALAKQARGGGSDAGAKFAPADGSGVRVTDVYDDIPGMKRVTTGSTLHSMATLGSASKVTKPQAGDQQTPLPISPVFGSATLTRDSSLRALTTHVFHVPATVIDPRSQWKVTWDVFVGVLIVFSVLSVPYFIGFDQNITGVWFGTNMLVDLVFVLDMVATFRTAYYRNYESELITDNKLIAKRYLATWFSVDLVSAVPWDWIVSELTSADSLSLRSLKLVRVLRLARLAKLFRLFRLSRTIEAVEMSLGVPPAITRLCKLFFQVAFIAHLLACFWYYVSTLGDPDVDGAWWIKAKMEDASTWDLYLGSIYFAYTTMTTVGYGDIAAVSDGEKVFAVFAMIIGGSTFGYIVGSMASLFGRFNGGAARNKEKMDQVAEYMRERNLSRPLRRKVRKYYQFYLDRKTAFDEASILGELTEGLKAEAIMHLNRDIIGKIPFLKPYMTEDGQDDGFTSYIMGIMNPMFVVPDDYIFKQGEIGLEMYFLVKGEVAVLKDAGTDKEDLLTTLGTGTFFGEIAVLIGTKRTASVRAVTYCNLFTLKKDDLNLMILHYPTLGQMMQDSIMTKLEAMVAGNVAMESHEEALEMAKSMRREVHRLGVIVKQVSKMNLLQKSSAAELVHTASFRTRHSGSNPTSPATSSRMLNINPVTDSGHTTPLPSPNVDPDDEYDSCEEEAALLKSFASGHVHSYLRRGTSLAHLDITGGAGAPPATGIAAIKSNAQGGGSGAGGGGGSGGGSGPPPLGSRRSSTGVPLDSVMELAQSGSESELKQARRSQPRKSLDQQKQFANSVPADIHRRRSDSEAHNEETMRKVMSMHPGARGSVLGTMAMQAAAERARSGRAGGSGRSSSALLTPGDAARLQALHNSPQPSPGRPNHHATVSGELERQRARLRAAQRRL